MSWKLKPAYKLAPLYTDPLLTFAFVTSVFPYKLSQLLVKVTSSYQ